MKFRRCFFISSLIVSCLIVCGSLWYAKSVYSAEKLYAPATFHFLLSSDKNIDVACGYADLCGGAKYILETKEKTAVAYDCYFSEEKISRAMENLQKKGLPCERVTVQIENLYIKGKEKKTKSKAIQGFLRISKQCFQTLDYLIERAESGDFSQERLKECVKTIMLVLSKSAELFSGKTFRMATKKWVDCAARMKEMSGQIVLAKDLRYCKIELCDVFIDFCRQFSL